MNKSKLKPESEVQTESEKNKGVVRQFNRDCIEEGKPAAFAELLADHVVNHSARPGSPNGPESFNYFLNEILRKGFPDLRVEIFEQIAERDLVATRKMITGTHTGELFGKPPTGKQVEIHVIDIIRLDDGKYAEHWGQSNFAEVLAGL
jgi:predicted ester cyclase